MKNFSRFLTEMNPDTPWIYLGCRGSFPENEETLNKFKQSKGSDPIKALDLFKMSTNA